jgi:hypothetical protein
MNKDQNEIGLSDPTTIGHGLNQNPELSVLLISLLKGVIYKDSEVHKWQQLIGLQASVRDYVSVLGLELVLDEAEGYAFLHSVSADDTSDKPMPDKPGLRLVARRPLSFPVSLLLALVRKKLAEFDAIAGDTRLVLSRDELVELMRVFLPESSNEARLLDQLDQNINKLVKLGFLRSMKQVGNKRSRHFEVRRIIKAFVDGQWLNEFDKRLTQYSDHYDSTLKTGDKEKVGGE